MDTLLSRINHKWIICTGILFALSGLFLCSLITFVFAPVVGNAKYLEMTFFYTPRMILKMAELYGSTGRTLYIQISLLADFLFPLFLSLFFLSTTIYLGKKLGFRKMILEMLFIASILCFAFDCIENICLIITLIRFPDGPRGLITCSSIVTLMKYALMVVFPIIIVVQLCCLKIDK